MGKRLIRPNAPRDAAGRPLWSTVVGVVGDARYRGLTDVRLDLYVPYLQNPDDPVKHLMVRASGDPTSLTASIRAEARRLEPAALVEGATTMERIVDGAVAPWRFSAFTLGILSAIALTLAALGVYGTVSQSVVERHRELAVRIALGGRPRDILRLIFSEGMWTTCAGIVVGLAAATAAGHALTGLLFGVPPVDPLTLAGMATVFVFVSLVALLLPTWRAMTVDPASVLRQE